MFVVCDTNNAIIFSMHDNDIVYRIYSCCQILIVNSMFYDIEDLEDGDNLLVKGLQS